MSESITEKTLKEYQQKQIALKARIKYSRAYPQTFEWSSQEWDLS